MAKSHMPLTRYAELAEVVDNLPILLREARRDRGLSMRAAAREISIALSTVDRIERGEDCTLSSAVAVLRWLDTAPYAAPGMPPGAPERAREVAETMPTVGQWPAASAPNPLASEGGAK